MECLFVNYPKCSTCKKAREWLEDRNLKFIDRDIVTDTPTYDELKQWINMSNKPINKFFNTSGMLYRQMELSKKLVDMSDDEKIKLLSSNGMLIKRPLLVFGNKVLTGFRIKEWEEEI